MIVGLSGELVLSGDDLTTITTERLEIFKKMVPPKEVSALYNKKDFYYTPDEDKSIYAFCMTVPEDDKMLTIIFLVNMPGCSISQLNLLSYWKIYKL